MPQELTVQQALELALRHQKAGHWKQAEEIYRQILSIAPANADALHLLGVLHCQTDRLNTAIDLVGRALQLDPRNAEFHCHMGKILLAAGRTGQGIASLEKAVAFRPQYAEGLNELGAALQSVGRLPEAIIILRRAVAVQPEIPRLRFQLGNALKQIGDMPGAIAEYEQAVAIQPAMVEAQVELGAALYQIGRYAQSAAAYRRAEALRPDSADIAYNIGAALHKIDQFDDAIDAYRKATALQADHFEAWVNLGAALCAARRLSEAIETTEHAIKRWPESQDLYLNLANALLASGRVGGAIDSLKYGLRLDPDSAMGHSNLAYALHFHPDYDAAAILQEQRRWNDKFAEPLKKRIRFAVNDRNPDRRLRIGYVAPDFKHHCQAFFTVPLLSSHDHQNFEIVCYADVPGPDSITQRIQGYSDVWRNTVGLSDDQLAEMIRADKVDILVDLTMRMSNGRLLTFAEKPAPVQVAWLAYPSTTGLDAIDYRLTDPYLDPPGTNDAFYSEQSIRLPHTFWCYNPLTDEPPVNPLPADTNGWITFGCLNNFCKFNHAMLRLWTQIMHAVPDSRLLLLCPQGEPRRDVLSHLNGIDPQRFELVERKPRREYLSLYHRIDLCLDTFPYNGHTTTLDAYWMGVPTVSLSGATAVSRAGFSQASNLGLTEFVAGSPKQFVQTAIDLANNRARLRELRATLRSRMEASPLMDAKRFARDIENIYRDIWRKWCATI